MILFLDQIRELIETNLLGSALLFSLFIISLLVILLLATKIDSKQVLILISPAIISIAGAALIPSWFAPLMFIATGCVLALIVYKLIPKEA